MKKLLSLVLVVLVLCATFCGCNEAELPATETTPETQATTEALDVNYEEVYADVLRSTYDFIATTDEVSPAAGQTGIYEATLTLPKEEALQVVGYTFMDITGDGFAELVIGSVSDHEDHKPVVYAAYTIAHDMSWLIVESSTKNAYFYLEDGTFLLEATGGAPYAIFGNFRVSQGGTSLMCNEFYFTSPSADNADVLEVYTNTLGKMVVDRSEKTDMTVEDFENLRADYEGKIVDLELTTFA